MVVVFDLDDTLYKEIDFVKSAFREIASKIGFPSAYNFMLEVYNKGENAFQEVIAKYNLKYKIPELLSIYRNHLPEIHLDNDAATFLNALKERKVVLGLITDGRTLQQKNKIKALRLDDYIPTKNIIISEEFGHSKPDKEGFVYFMKTYPNEKYVYVGDNTSKDFIAPNSLGWRTICLIDNGENIHKQDFSLDKKFLPAIKIHHLTELLPQML